MDKRILIITIAVLLILSVLLIIYNALRQEVSPPPAPSFPTPTLISPQSITLAPGQPSPTPLPIVFTGAINDDDLSPEEIDLTEQKRTLRNSTPLEEAAFIITFDFADDKFVVQLKEPKEENRTTFEQWRQNNYPAIPLDRFLIE